MPIGCLRSLPLARWVSACLGLWLSVSATWGQTGQPFISEFMAANQASLTDEDGDASDWIELHNPTSDRVNLAGWSLTDDSTAPTKWRFPERFIEPGGFLVVFASGKNRTATGTLHTNFRLEASGEYLALFSPGQTLPVSVFAPTFPPQETDLSYGIPQGSSSQDLLTGTTARVLVPTTAELLPVDWFAPGLLMGPEWQVTQGFPLGFDRTPGGPAPYTNLALAGTATQSTTGYSLGAELAIDGDPSTFTHTASEDPLSSWQLDLGALTEIGRIVLRNRDSCCQSRFRDLTVNLLGADGKSVVWTSGLLNPENVLNGPASLTLDLFELNVGSIEARWIQVIRTPDPDLSGSGGTGNEDEDNVLSLGEVEVFGVGSLSYAGLLNTDLTSRMQGRAASAFVRVPFVVGDPQAVTSLQLVQRHDDGVVTYLNGEQLNFLNSPFPAVWNSVALQKRNKNDVLKPQLTDLLPFASLLQPGTNWLAFQGLNASTNDAEFFLDAQLIAGAAGGSRTALYLDRATPGASNVVSGTLGRVADTRFSHNRGRYTTAFDLVITTASVGAQIRYTLDGTAPTETTGLIYTGPIRVDRSTVVRAGAFQAGYRPTNVDTHTYLFLANVIAQPNQPPGFPTSWAGVPADYAMDPRITQAPAYANRLPESLVSLPSLALTTANDNLFASSRGIYANPERGGADWERPVSFEWIEQDGTNGFQVDCGLRIQGGYFRQRNVTQKHSLRVLFKEIYGTGRLNQNLFGEFGAAREFDTLVLRAGANDGYAWNDARDTEQFIRDEFGRRTLLAMGQPTARGRFVHLYLNGLYWGLYNLTERPAEDFSSTYLGGEPEDWDAINSGDVKSGSLDAWNAFLAGVRSVSTLTDYQRLKGLNADGSRNAAFPEYFDGPNYMDYMLANIWGGNWDWPNKNFWFGRHRGGLAGGFKFYLWDFENTMGNNRDRSPLNMVSPRADIASSWVGEPHNRLKAFSEYRLEFADRVQRHFFNRGPLSPETLIARYRELADRVEPSIIAETARWGDDNWNPPQDLTDWQRERDWLLGTYLPQRTGVVLNQLRSAGLFPQTAAPEFQPAGGSITRTTPITLRTTASELYYTTNGLDPRLPGGAIRPEAIKVVFSDTGGPTVEPELIRSGALWKYLSDGTNPGSDWKELTFPDESWAAGTSPLGYGDGDEATVIPFVDADAATSGVQKNATSHFRRTITVADPAAFERLILSVTFDDAVAVYVNGVEVLRSENLPAGAAFNTYASGTSADNAILVREDLPNTTLRAGLNVIAVEVHQSDPGSSDLSFDLTLTGVVSNTGTTHTTAPFFLDGPTWVKARAKQGAEWSALNETFFNLELVPATSNHLVISEFCFRPADAGTVAEQAITTDRDDFEFIELLNASTQAIDLTGVRFVSGILFTFSAQQALAPGERVVLVKRTEAFAARYGATPVPGGEFEGNLSNSGEELILVDATGQTIRRFSYSDRSPWPPSANANGYSLVLQQPATRPDHADPGNWRASVLPGGSPGATDTTRFAGTPTADANGNGQVDLFDYAFGGVLSDPVQGIILTLEAVPQGLSSQEHLVITFPRMLAAEDARVSLESADSLAGPWRSEPADFTLIRELRTAAGPVRQSYRLNTPTAPGATWVRLAVTLLP